MTDTNRQPDPTTLQRLAGLADLPEQGTIFTATVHKMGEERGKVVYGDDTKQVLIWTGFSHLALISKSKKMLDHQLAKGGYIERLAQATLEEHEGTTIEDVCHALQEIREWFRLKLANPMAGEMNPVGGFWIPLKVNGVYVRGCSIYAGRARPENSRAPIPGTIYVKGLKLGERMITPAPNGYWTPDSQPKTLAKQIIKENLPIGLYCQYRLEPARVSGIAVAAEAVKVARDLKIPIDPGALTSMFKVG